MRPRWGRLCLHGYFWGYSYATPMESVLFDVFLYTLGVKQFDSDGVENDPIGIKYL
jgi:hypothetical protein